MKAEEKLDRLKFAKLDAEPVILGFQAEDKAFVRNPMIRSSNGLWRRLTRFEPADTTRRSGLSIAALGPSR